LPIVLSFIAAKRTKIPAQHCGEVGHRKVDCPNRIAPVSGSNAIPVGASRVSIANNIPSTSNESVLQESGKANERCL
jgi:hypothetical protein